MAILTRETTATGVTNNNAPLTNAELDNNFVELVADIADKAALTDLSVTTNAAGTAALSYSNSTGTFTYTPPDLSGYQTSAALNEDIDDRVAALLQAGNGIALDYDDVNNELAISSEVTEITAYNGTGSTLTKGTVVYQSGVQGTDISVAAASNSSASTMPAVGIVISDIANAATGQIAVAGLVRNLDTSSFTAGDVLYVGTSGGLTATKPTGESNLIQNFGRALKINASSGEVLVLGAGRTNDVPNLADGNVFIGNASNVAEKRALVEADISDFGTYLTTVALNDVSDVVITSLSTGQILKYNGTNWVNDADAGGIALTDLSVTTNSAGTAALSYNNTSGVFSYTPPDLSSYLTGITGQSIENLSDVNTMTPTDGQVLTWDNTNSRWDAADASGGSITTDPLSMYQDAGTAPTPYVWMDFGNNMNDSGSANLPATSGSTPVYTTDRDGVSNHAYDYGSSSTLGWATNPASANSDFFWGIWYKSDGTSFGTNAIILGTAYSAGNELIHIGATPVNSTTAQLQIKHTQGGSWSTSVASTQPTWTDWNHYAMVKSGNSLYLYLNGAVVATATLAGTYTYQNSLNVGLYGSGRATGDYDDIQLYTTIPITAGQSFNTNNIGGGAVVVGQLEVTGNQTNSLFKVRQYESGVLTEYTIADFEDIVNDTTPQLGGNLDLNSNNITGTGNIDITGTTTTDNLIVDGSVEEQQYSLTGTAIDPANGTIQYKTLSANTTFTESLADGEYVTLLIQNTGGHTITWPTGIYWPNGVAPTLATSGWNLIQLWHVNTILYGSFVSA